MKTISTPATPVAPSDDTALSLPALNETVTELRFDPDQATREPQKYPPITVKVATTRAELEGAFRLVYRRYLGSGLCSTNPHEMRVTPYHLLPTTAVFVAVYQGEVIFTMSLIADGGRGVPMESVFPAEVGELRAKGVRFGEVSCMADRRRDMTRFLPLFVRVTRHMFQFARHHGVERLVVAVHPKHARFYERFFGFRQLSQGVRRYQSVENKPAVACSLDWGWMTAERHAQFFGEPIPAGDLQPRSMTADELAYFGQAALRLGNAELLSGGYEIAAS
jgi:hypothetical protein